MNKQTGSATLIVTMILLVAVTLTVLWTSRSVVTDIRLSANEVRMREAFANANAALDRALNQLISSGLDPRQYESTDSKRPYSYILIPAGDALPTACPSTPGLIDDPANPLYTKPPSIADTVIFACGWSEDESARRPMVQKVGRANAFANAPDYPLTVRGGANIGGSGLLVNTFSDKVVWSGLSVESWGAKPKIQVRNPGDPVRSPAAPTQPPYEVGNIEPYVDAGWQDLSRLNNDEFFANFFGLTPSDYRDPASNLVSLDVTPAQFSAVTPADAAGKVVWVNGDLTLNGGTYGSANEPVILIVDGDLTLRGGAEINGVVYVAEDFDAAGTAAINGAAVIAGDAKPATGNFTLTFNPFIVGEAQALGPIGGEFGSWRDFLH
ncbi:hypothetical protein ACKVEX_13710 [Rhodocyclaceae bacterium SMB388]